jgi:hypothetical protein
LSKITSAVLQTQVRTKNFISIFKLSIISTDGDYTANVSEEDSSEHKKRQAEQMDPDMEEVQSIWQEMWQTMVEGAKKIVKKVAQSFEREAEQQQPEYEH